MALRTSGARVLVISAADSRFMPLLRGLIGSLASSLAVPGVSFACFDLGLSVRDRDWLSAHKCICVPPRTHLGVSEQDYSPADRSFLARPFLREYFPGYDVYVWIDSDIWVQDAAVFQQYVIGALEYGMAITHEDIWAYRFDLRLLGWQAKHMALAYGPTTAALLMRRPHLNAGFFAIRSDAPHWEAWAHCYATAIRRRSALQPYDQFALNRAIYRGDLPGEDTRLTTRFLDPRCNWICDRSVPMWNDALGAYCKPRPPFEVIGAIHLAGSAKSTAYEVSRTEGSKFRTYIVNGSSPAFPQTAGPLEANILQTVAG